MQPVCNLLARYAKSPYRGFWGPISRLGPSPDASRQQTVPNFPSLHRFAVSISAPFHCRIPVPARTGACVGRVSRMFANKRRLHNKQRVFLWRFFSRATALQAPPSLQLPCLSPGRVPRTRTHLARGWDTDTAFAATFNFGTESRSIWKKYKGDR